MASETMSRTTTSDDDDVVANAGDKRKRGGEKALRTTKPKQAVKLKQIGATRWSCRVYALVAIMRTYSPLLEALQAIAVDATDAKHTAEALGLRMSMMSFDFIIAMFIMIKVLGFTHDLSQLLQRRDQELGNIAAQVQYTMDYLDKLRLDESWTSIWNEARKLATHFACGIAIPGPETTMSTRRDIPNFMLGARNIESQTRAIDWFRINVFCVVINNILSEMKYRFNNANVKILKCLMFFQPERLGGFQSVRGHSLWF